MKAGDFAREPRPLPPDCPEPRAGGGRSPGRKRPKRGNVESGAPWIPLHVPSLAALTRTPGPVPVPPGPTPGVERRGKGTREAPSAASHTHRGAAAPLSVRPAPPQRCERPATPRLLCEGSACSRRRHRHRHRFCHSRRRRRPVAEAAVPPRFRSLSVSRENFSTRPRPAPPPRDFPRRKRPRAQALLLGRAPAGSHSCHPGWSAVAQPQLTAALTSQAQVILPSESPKWPELQAGRSGSRL
ncbi:uncharacterized protein DKFZp434B061-like isoform X2 [Symphalangus syndactylus]|uniref:uncharacterized protein DKFZp434B061-like isoform X2 n=1 Tax=Symphalangus syndactylus TaxID=9590 RepID=UPI0030055AAC